MHIGLGSLLMLELILQSVDSLILEMEEQQTILSSLTNV